MIVTAKSKNAIRVSTSRIMFLAFNAVFFTLMVIVCFYPMWYVFIQSLSESAMAVKAVILPVNFTFNNYVQLMQMPEIFHAFMVSVLRTVLGTCGTVMCCMFAGYLFTKENIPFRKFIYRMMVITMYVSGGLIPTYLVIKEYGLINSFLVYIVPSLIGAYNVILIKTFIEQLPKELEESARIDGASTGTVFFRIILPLSMPIAATIAIYASNSQWNSFIDNQLYTSAKSDLTTLQLLLYNYLNQSERLIAQLEKEGVSSAEMSKILTPRGIKMTVTMISVIPIMCVYPFMQRFLVKGIMIGAVKG